MNETYIDGPMVNIATADEALWVYPEDVRVIGRHSIREDWCYVDVRVGDQAVRFVLPVPPSTVMNRLRGRR